MSEWHHMAILQANQQTFSSRCSSHNLRSYAAMASYRFENVNTAGGCHTQNTPMQTHSVLHFLGLIHPGRLTAGTNSHHPFRKENDLNQTSMMMFQPLIFRHVTYYFFGRGLKPSLFMVPRILPGDLGRRKESSSEPTPGWNSGAFGYLVSGKVRTTFGSSLPKSPGRWWSQMLSCLTWQTIYLTCIYIRIYSVYVPHTDRCSISVYVTYADLLKY